MHQRITRRLAAVLVAVALTAGCSSSAVSTSTSTSTSTVDEAPTTDLDIAVDALVDRLGPRDAFDAVLDALEAGLTAEEIIANPGSVQAP